jgi:hypothetical protein
MLEMALMNRYSELSLEQLAGIMQTLQSGQLLLSTEEREILLSEIESRVQRKKQSPGRSTATNIPVLSKRSFTAQSPSQSVP